jgi:predicted permease
MGTVLRDLRYAFRQVRKSPAFTLVVVLMLALGIGANTAVFSVMNALLMQLLPVSRPEGLSYVRMANGQGQPPNANNTGNNSTSFSEVTFEALRQRSDVFEELIAYVPLSFSRGVAVRHGELPEEAAGTEVSGNFFSGVGVRMQSGRGFTLADEKDHSSVVVISYDYWTRSYARDPGVLGQTLYVKGVPMTVVGITAPGFKGVEPLFATDFWIPLQDRPELNAWGTPTDTNKTYGSPKWWFLLMMARLRPGVTSTQAQQALAGTFGAVVKETIGTDNLKEWKPLLEFVPARGISLYTDYVREPIRILMGLVALVLLIACTNVAMMVQARNTVREREFSLRLAIGARRGTIFRQLLFESMLLVTAGAGLGWLFAVGATRMPAVWSGVETGLSPDLTVLLFTLLISSVAALAFGLIPLWSAVRAPVAGVLRATSAGTTTSHARVVGGRVVLAFQVAFCLVLLMAASLLLRTLRNYATQHLGMDAKVLLVFGVTPQGQIDSHLFYRNLLDRLRQVPGVESVSMAHSRPGSGWSSNNGLTLDGVQLKGKSVRSNNVGAGFFHTLGVPVLAGREIAESDTQDTQPVVLVNETFVKQHLANTNPLGHQLGGKRRYTIVGVVRDSKYRSVDEPPMPMSYYAAMQAPSLSTMQIEVRTRGNPMAMLPEIRKRVAAMYPNVPLQQPMTQFEQFTKSYRHQWTFAAMGSFFGVLAALLVATGLYGNYSYRVSRRTMEIGVRMALGASRAQVLTMVIRESLWVLVAGLVVGIPLTWFTARSLKSMLYQLSPLDPISFLIAIAVMIAVCGFAALLPARRAASIEPLEALRAE